MDIIPHLKTIAIATLLLSVALYIAVSWSELTSLYLTGVLGFALAIPLISLFIGFVLSPPLARRTTAETPHRTSKITSIISISLQNIGACLVCAFFVLPIICVGRSCDLDLCARFDLRHSARDGRIGQAT
jgi:MFS family permease